MKSIYRHIVFITLISIYSSPTTATTPPPTYDGTIIRIKNLDEQSYLTADGKDLVHDDTSGGIDNSLWIITLKNGSYVLKNKATGRYLDYDDKDSIDTSDNTNSPDKLWNFIQKQKNGKTYYEIQSVKILIDTLMQMMMESLIRLKIQVTISYGRSLL